MQESGSSQTSKLVVLLLAVVLVLGSIAVVVSLVSSGQDAPAQEPAAVQPSASTLPTARAYPSPDKKDTPEGREMAAWDARAANMIVPTVDFLQGSFVKTTSEEQMRSCEILKGYLDLGKSLPPAPAADVATSFGSWLSSLEDVASTCLAGKADMSDKEYLTTVEAKLGISSANFGSYLTTLAQYIDMNAPAPAGVPEPTALPSASS